MKDLFLLLPAAPALLFAQGYADLSTDFTGSRLAFTSSSFRPGESPQQRRGRVYRFETGELLQAGGEPPSLPSCMVASSRLVAPAFVPGNDAAFLFHEETLCSGRMPPVPPEPQYAARLTGLPVLPERLQGQLQFSSNGRYAALQPTPGTENYFSPLLFDTETRERTRLPANSDTRYRRALASPQHAVSDRGQVLLVEHPYPRFPFTTHQRVFLYNRGSLRDLNIGNAHACWLDPRSRYVLCGTTDGLLLLDLATGLQRILLQDGAFEVRLSDDGRRMLLIGGGARRTARMFDMPSGEETHRFAEEPASIALSGDGRIAFLVERGGSVWRIQVDSGQREEWLGPIGEFLFILGAPVPGSLQFAAGSYALPEAVEAEGNQLPLSLNGYSVLLDGEPLPLFKTGPAEIRFQLPWELDTSGPQRARRLEIQHERNPHFLTALTQLTPAGEPTLQLERQLAAAAEQLVAAHGDFRGLITRDDPAEPGETIHLYATGLGPVATGFAVTGRRTPPGAHPAVRGVRCTVAPASPANPKPGEDVVVPYAGLAGTLAGIYQVDVTLPTTLETGSVGGSSYIQVACANRAEEFQRGLVALR